MFEPLAMGALDIRATGSFACRVWSTQERRDCPHVECGASRGEDASEMSSVMSSVMHRTRRCRLCCASVRKATKRNLEYASVVDWLKEMQEQMQSEIARKKGRHLEHWMKEWPKQFNWKQNDWGSFSELRPTHGGGRDGFGATERACMDIFQQCK